MTDNDGIWAPTLRYHNGTFYLITTAHGCGGNFYMTAKNPAGPWSDPVWLKDAPGIDPSLFFDVELLTPNSWSRPQTRLKKVDGIVIHYTANPGSTAMQNRDYFENLPETQEAQASSHFVVGIEGEVVQCIPTSEWSYASNQRNFDTISIECCHPDDSGEFTDETYNSVVQLAGFLCKRFNLTSDDVIRHYDVTEKLCPLYYVEHEDAWIQMKADIQAYADSLS